MKLLIACTIQLFGTVGEASAFKPPAFDPNSAFIIFEKLDTEQFQWGPYFCKVVVRQLHRLPCKAYITLI
jgi:hypothetical protein